MVVRALAKLDSIRVATPDLLLRGGGGLHVAACQGARAPEVECPRGAAPAPIAAPRLLLPLYLGVERAAAAAGLLGHRPAGPLGDLPVHVLAHLQGLSVRDTGKCGVKLSG